MRAGGTTTLLRVAVGIVAVAAASLAFRPRPLVVLWPVLEDGFYSLSVARNTALGRGVTVDGVAPTNGFQPLFTFLTVPAFLAAAGDRYGAVRLVHALHWLFYVGAAAVMGLLAARLWADRGSAEKTAVVCATAVLY